jgi:hypothetical protein
MSNKIFISLAAAAVLAGSGFAMPAFAAALTPVAAGMSCDSTATQTDDPFGDFKGIISGELAAKGYKVSGIDSFGGCVRAYITGPDGSTHMAYFTPNSLKRIDING